MKKDLLNLLRCPDCSGDISLRAADKTAAGPNGVEKGELECAVCKNVFAIKSGIPRFVSSDNYADSFGFQWNIHSRTQIDEYSKTSISRDRFFGVTGWPQDLKGEKILEAGCGAGRFTRVALTTGADVYSFDYSYAKDANLANNGFSENFYPFQADIYGIPLKKGVFDKIFCFGVLQHCPDPKKAFLSLLPYLRPGGQICIDIYDLSFRCFVNPKYWLRPLTRQMQPEQLYKLVRRAVPAIFPVKKWVTEHLPFGKYFAFFIPVAYHKGFIAQADRLSYEELLEWSILDTFDKYAPKYDNPQTIRTVKRWFNTAGLTDVRVVRGPNGINARAYKPE